MVKLDNPYPKPKQIAPIIICTALLFGVGFFCFKLNIFSFIYQYAISILIVVLCASLFDRLLFSKNRLFYIAISLRKLLLMVVIVSALFFIIFFAVKIFIKGDLIYSLYKTGPGISNPEFFILMLVIIPLFEEIFFRGFLQFLIMEGFGAKFGYILTSLIYALFFIYTEDFRIVSIYFVLGLFFGYIYLLKRSVLLTTLLHSIFMLLLVIFPV